MRLWFLIDYILCEGVSKVFITLLKVLKNIQYA